MEKHSNHMQMHDHSHHMDMGKNEHSMPMKMNHSSMNMHDHHQMMIEDFKKRFFVSLVLTVPILFLSPMLQMLVGIDFRFPGSQYLLFALSTVLFIYGATPFFSGAKDELAKKSPAMMTLVAMAISIAYVYSSLTVFGLSGMDFFWELATLIDIMLLGHWIEMKSVMGASKALQDLLALMPDVAHRVNPDGTVTDVKVDALHTGDIVQVKPGEKIPIDGTVTEGYSEVNESMITGESVPVVKRQGSTVVGGSINEDGALKFKVSRTGDDTFLSQVIKLVQEAQESKSNTQRLMDVAAKWLFYIAAVCGTATFASWMALGRGLDFSIERAVTVIVIACPHALGLAAPLVSAVSSSIAAKNGLLIRNRAAFEKARNLNAVVFDKTGTLTMGQFGVTDIIAEQGSKNELLAITASVESNSNHPIALGIVLAAKEAGLPAKDVQDFQNISGQGLFASVDGAKIMIVRPSYLKEHKIAYNEVQFHKLAEEKKTIVFVLKNNVVLGGIALSDIIRPSAKDAVRVLKKMGVEPIMLTGDSESVALYVGKALGIDTVVSEVLPEQKSLKIEELKSQGRIVGMTGDGINDAPALATADLGIAIGAGTDVAIETSDVVLVKNNLMDVVNVLKLSRATFKKMKQNLIWATGYNIVALPLAAGVLSHWGIMISPAVGAFFMSLSTIIVAINARLLKID